MLCDTTAIDLQVVASLQLSHRRTSASSHNSELRQNRITLSALWRSCSRRHITEGNNQRSNVARPGKGTATNDQLVISRVEPRCCFVEPAILAARTKNRPDRSQVRPSPGGFQERQAPRRAITRAANRRRFADLMNSAPLLQFRIGLRLGRIMGIRPAGGAWKPMLLRWNGQTN